MSRLRASHAHIRWILRGILGFGVLFGLTLHLAMTAWAYSFFNHTLDDPTQLMNQNNRGVTLVDRGGRPFFTLESPTMKQFKPLAEMNPWLPKALVAMEDKNFYHHRGYSLEAIVASAVTNAEQGEIKRGGSTITQQLVKSTLLTPKRSYLRKYEEVVLATQLEDRYSKDQILEMYLNTVYFGEGAYGAEQAAQTYFNRSAKDLTLAQSSYLVGLLPAPSRLSSSANDRTQGLERQQLVLQALADQGVITAEQTDAAHHEPLSFATAPAIEALNDHGAHFAMMVRGELLERYGSEAALARSGITVRTTLDLDDQLTAETAVRDQVHKLARNRVTNGAAVVIDPTTGEIRSLVGSVDWSHDDWGAYNVATALRQPGSSFKPVVYAAALERNLITPATVLRDRPTSYVNPWETYAPRDYDGKFRGNVSVRRALATSLNVPAVEVLNQLTVPAALDYAKQLGFTTFGDPKQYGLSLVLGAGEVRLVDLTNAYATFANGGTWHQPRTILAISDKFGQPVYQSTDESHRAVAPDVAFLISSILSDNQARREIFGTQLTIDRPAAVKTGTTSRYKDAWTLGYTPHLAIGAWVGNNNGQPMDRIAGALGPAPIWKRLMTELSADRPKTTFTPPESVTKLAACGREEFFRRENAPPIQCPTPTPPADEQPSDDPAPSGEVTAVAAVKPEPPPQGGGDDSVVPPGHEKRDRSSE